MTPLLGIDISHHQGREGMSRLRFRALDKAGVGFAIIRASIGTLTDGAFGPNRERAEAQGWEVGAYHYLVADTVADVGRQMDTFARTVREHGGLSDAVPMFIDVEWTRDEPRLRWRRDVQAAADALRRELPPKRHVNVYTSEGYWRALGNPDGAETFDELWQARWPRGRVDEATDLPERPPLAGFGGWRRSPLWQFGPLRYRAGGHPQSLDGNAWYGTAEGFRALGGESVPSPLPDRPRYRAGHNALLDSVLLALPGIEPASMPGPAWPAGVEAAREALAAALGELRIEGGT